MNSTVLCDAIDCAGDDDIVKDNRITKKTIKTKVSLAAPPL